MKLSDLQEKDIVNINDGRKIGRIVDAEVDMVGKINYLVVDEKRGLRTFLSSNGDINITFDKIKRIGTDVILVDLWYNYIGERDE